jgi:hypothetical protein
MTVLLYCFIQNTANSHLRMLQKIKEKIGVSKKDAYYHILSRLLLFEDNEVPAPEIFSFYLNEASHGIISLSPVTRTKCLSILSFFSRIDLQPILPIIPQIQKIAKSCEYWELKGQLIILCANALLYFNTVALEMRQGEGEEAKETHADQISEVPGSAQKSERGKFV